MKEDELLMKLNANVGGQIASISEIVADYSGLPLNPDMTGLIIKMDDPVKTELKVSVVSGKLKIELSQMEAVPTRKTYLNF